MPKIDVTKLSTTYELEFEEITIKAEIDSEGDITLYPQRGGKNFIFDSSEPDVVEGVAACMAEAARLAKQLKEETEDGGKEN